MSAHCGHLGERTVVSRENCRSKSPWTRECFERRAKRLGCRSRMSDGPTGSHVQRDNWQGLWQADHRGLCCGKDFGFTGSKKRSHQRVLRRQMASVVKGFPDSWGAEARSLIMRNLGTSGGCDHAVAMDVMRSWVLDTFWRQSQQVGWMWVWEKEKSQRWLRLEQLEGSSWDQLRWRRLQVRAESLRVEENGKEMHLEKVHIKTREMRWRGSGHWERAPRRWEETWGSVVSQRQTKQVLQRRENEQLGFDFLGARSPADRGDQGGRALSSRLPSQVFQLVKRFKS